jgi:hypothetical protein
MQQALFERRVDVPRQNTGARRRSRRSRRTSPSSAASSAMPWSGRRALEAEIKERTGATLRCVPLRSEPEQLGGDGACARRVRARLLAAPGDGPARAWSAS